MKSSVKINFMLPLFLFIFALGVLLLWPGDVRAAETVEAGDFQLTSDKQLVKDTDYSYDDASRVLKILSDKKITIANKVKTTFTQDRILVPDGVTATITLDGVDINVTLKNDQCAFSLEGNASVSLTLADQSVNSLKSGARRAGLQVPGGTTLTLGGSGRLDTNSGVSGAGIGGGNEEDGGDITINGGTVLPEGGDGGAGIGGGLHGAGGTITINGGTVTAKSADKGAGIGGGAQGTAGTVTINGGTVTATGGGSGAGIGGTDGLVTINGGSVAAKGGDSGAGIGGGDERAGGANGAGIGGGKNGGGGTVIIDGGSVNAKGTTIYGQTVSAESIGHGAGNNGLNSGTLTTTRAVQDAKDKNLSRRPVVLTLEDKNRTANQAVTALNVDGYTGVQNTTRFGEKEYGIRDMQTDKDAKVYLYLPETAAAKDTEASLTPDSLSEYIGSFDANRAASLSKGPDGNIDLSQLGDGNNLYIWNDKYGIGTDATEAEKNSVKYKDDYTLTGGTENNPIKNTVTVMDGYTAGERTITLNGLNIDVSKNNEQCAFSLEGTARVSLMLTDNTQNTLKSGQKRAGLQAPEGAALTLGGSGSLNATGGDEGAGIGGSENGTGGKITIDSGSVTATGGTYGAGIGGGGKGDGGSIAINGGNVTATSQAGGADIGGGNQGAGAEVTIDGGSVNADRIDKQPKNSQNNGVYRVTVQLADVSTVTPVYPAGKPDNYGLKDVRSDGAGKLYFYLPANDPDHLENWTTVSVRKANPDGELVTGDLWMKNNHNNTLEAGKEATDLAYSQSRLTYNGKAQAPALMRGSAPATADSIFYKGNQQSSVWSDQNSNTDAGSGYPIVSQIKANNGYGQKILGAVYGIEPAAPTVTDLPTASSLTYGQKLSDSKLEGGKAKDVNGSDLPGIFAWADPNTKPSVADSDKIEYTVIFTPEDTVNYNTADNLKVKIKIDKADPDYDVPTGLTATYGQTLADVSLPQGFSWQDASNTPVGNAGSNRFKVTYTPADTDNYNTIKDIEVTIAVAKADSNLTVTVSPDSITYGDSFSLTAVSATKPADNTLAKATEDTVDFYLGDPTAGKHLAAAAVANGEATADIDKNNAGYPDAGTVTITAVYGGSGSLKGTTGTAELTVNQAEGKGSVRLVGWTYGEAANDPVPESDTNGIDHVSYQYKEQGADDSTYKDKQPTQAGSYTVRATFAETQNYTQAIATADFKISGKILKDLSLSDATYTYDGAPHSLAVKGEVPPECKVVYDPENATDVGDYQTTATISGEGYEPLALTATLHISKATPKMTITAETKKEIKVGEPVKLTVDVKGVGSEPLTGSVKLLDQTLTLENGQATADYTPKDANPKEITADYTPDSTNYNSATASITLTANKKVRDPIIIKDETKTFGDPSFKLTPTGGSLQDDETYHYASDDTTVAQVDAEGSVTLTGAGSAQITVSVAENDIWNKAEATMTLTVKKADIEGITFEDATFTADGTAHSIKISGELPEGASVTYDNNDQTDPGSYTVMANIDGGQNYNNLVLTATMTIVNPYVPVKPTTPDEVADAIDKLPTAEDYDKLTDEEKEVVKDAVDKVVDGITDLPPEEQAQIPEDKIEKLGDLYDKVYNVIIHKDTSAAEGLKTHVKEEDIKVYGAGMAAKSLGKDVKITITQDRPTGGEAMAFSLKLFIDQNGSYTPVELSTPIVIRFTLPESVKAEGLEIHHMNPDGTLKEILTPIINGRELTFMTTSFSNFLFVETGKPTPTPGPSPTPTQKITNPLTGKTLTMETAMGTGAVLLSVIALIALGGWQSIKKRDK